MKHAENPPAVAVHAKPPSGSKPTSIWDQLKMVSGPVYVAVMLFAMSTWIGVVGIWVEMPLLVNALPESWNLPSYLVIIIQCANLAPAAYALWDKLRQRNRQATNESQNHHQQQQQHSRIIDAEVVVSLVIILTAIVSMLMLSLFWDHTTLVASTQRSIVLLTLVCFASLSCCTSSVVFLPYMARFPSVYISAYYFDQGLCGLVPGLLGLAQVVGHETQCRNETDVSSNLTTLNIAHYNSSTRFSVSAFFLLITGLLCVSVVAFCCLNFARRCRDEMVVSDVTDQRLKKINKVAAERELATGLPEDRQTPSVAVSVVSQQRRFISLFITVGIVNALWNGVLPATQTYTCLPYGDIVYKLAVCLSWVVSPLATLPNMLAPTSSLPLITGLGSVASVIAAFHLLLASQSPHPILQGSIVGEVIVVVTSVVMAFCFSLVRVSASSVFRREGGRTQLLYCGAVTQLGSLCGALVSFVLVAVVKVLQSSLDCTQ